MKKVLTIAGSDCSGGAGIQADIKTITVHKMYAMSAVTALTAQNTTGVYGVQESDPEFLANQLDCIFQDIYPDAVKIGMVASEALINVIVDKLTEYKAENIVADPVMMSTSGGKLIQDSATEALIGKLLPASTIITPNLAEGKVLSGINIKTEEDMENAAVAIAQRMRAANEAQASEGIKIRVPAVLLKGGHLSTGSNDLLYIPDENRRIWFRGKYIDNPNTHGTGCTLSSAVACNLAAGLGIEESVMKAKEYITKAIKAGLDMGAGRGPLDHMHSMK